MKTNTRLVLLDFKKNLFLVFENKKPVSPLYNIEGPLDKEDVEYMRTYDYKDKA